MTDPTPDPTPTRDEAVLTGWKLVPVEPTESMMAIGRTCGTNSANTYAAMLASAPAPASGGVDAVLNLYREAVRIDVKMEGPQFMGANSSALKRAWEADRASLSPAATPVSEAGGELSRQLRDRVRGAEEECRTDDADLMLAAAKSIERMDGAASDANALYLKMSAERDALRGALEIAKRRFTEISTGAAYQPRVHAGAGVIEIDAALAKPASSPAGGDDLVTWIESLPREPTPALRAAYEAYKAAGLPSGEDVRAVRFVQKESPPLVIEDDTLSQSTSAGRVGE